MTPMSIKIDDDIPIPLAKKRTYPLHELVKVGQSFFIPAGDNDLMKMMRSVHSKAYHLKPQKFTVRIVEEGGVRGIRVWRIE